MEDSSWSPSAVRVAASMVLWVLGAGARHSNRMWQELNRWQKDLGLLFELVIPVHHGSFPEGVRQVPNPGIPVLTPRSGTWWRNMTLAARQAVGRTGLLCSRMLGWI
jgi:hypothetical protein